LTAADTLHRGDILFIQDPSQGGLSREELGLSAELFSFYPIPDVRLLLVAGFLFMLVVPVQRAHSQDSRPQTIAVFLDCQNTRCDFDYIRREIDYVNHVRDRVGADVHVLVTRESSGSGGSTFQLEFIGLGPYAGRTDILTFSSSSTDIETERRAGLTETIARGLVPYLVRTRTGDQLVVRMNPAVGESLLDEGPVEDPWDFWVFNVGLSGDYEAEESNSSLRLHPRISANRVTEDWKIETSGRFSYRENTYDVTDGELTVIQRDGSVYGLVVKSVGDHWGIGGTTYSQTSTRDNIDYSTSVSPTVEYNIFPYDQSSQRELRIQWELNFRHYNYNEITVFEKEAETVMQQQLSVRMDLSRPWGSANARVQFESYLTDFEKSLTDLYRIEVGGDIYFRLLRGLSVNLGAQISSIHDQIYLAQTEISDEDILLGRISLPTSFSYEVEMGFSYRFGSIFNNVVNSRFGG
jgi:hypothetical protein